MNNLPQMNAAIWSQFGASLDMLEQAIVMCPEEHWDTSIEFWYLAYHCTFWMDYYLTKEPNTFQPPIPFTLSEFDFSGVKPERTYTKIEVLNYIKHCRFKAYQLISELTSETLDIPWVNDYKVFTIFEILMYNMRHIQHHSAQLNLLLRQTINNAPVWISKAKNNEDYYL